MEGDGGIGNGVGGVGIGDDHQIPAHNGLALGIRSGLVVELFQLLRLQHLAADSTLLMTAALQALSGFHIHNPVTGGVAGGVGVAALVGIPAPGTGERAVPHLRTSRRGHFLLVVMGGQVGIFPLITVPAPGTGKGGVSHLRAGGLGDNGLIVVTQSVLNHRAADGAKLGRGAGGSLAGHMARGGVALQTGSPATDAGVLGHALAGAAGADYLSPIVPAVAQRVGIVRDKAGTAALTEMDGLAAALAGGWCGLAHIVVGQRRGNVLNMALPADRTLPQGVAGAGTGGGDGGSGELMRPLGDGGLLGIPAPLADVQRFAGGLAGGLPDDGALIGVAQGRLIVPLFNHAALDAEVAVIAQGQAGGVYAIQ